MNITKRELLNALMVHSEFRIDPIAYVAMSPRGVQFHVTAQDACRLAAEYIAQAGSKP